MKKVIVIGGGLAGLAAATRLAEAGLAVTLLEKRATLGGRASSTVDPESGQAIDNCQHVLLGCCSQLLNFYQRLGVESKITFHDEFVFIDSDGKISKLKGSELPCPFHLLPSFLKLKFLRLRDKIAILWAMTIMALTSEKRIQKLDSLRFDEWLKAHHQTRQAINRFWSVILVSALNEALEKISTKYAFKTFREAFLKSKKGFHTGVPNVPLSELYSKGTLKHLEGRQGKILLQKKVDRFRIQDNQVQEVVLSDGSALSSDFYVSALPFHELLEILPQEVVQEYDFFKRLRLLETSPITGIHLFFDRPITELETAIFLDRKIQWLFNKTKNFEKESEGGQYLELVISASRDFIPLSKNEAVALALKELKDIFPKARGARLLRAIVIKELKATFSPQPGADPLRPPQQSPIKNLMVAGDWTRTDWPATMESAVRSGEIAAEEIMKMARLDLPRVKAGSAKQEAVQSSSSKPRPTFPAPSEQTTQLSKGT